MAADFWAGYVSGAAGIIIGNPLDLIKVRLQATTTISIAPSNAADSHNGNPALLGKGRSALPRTHDLHTAASSKPSVASSATKLALPRPRISSFAESLSGLPAPILTYGALNALLFTTYNRSLLWLAPPDSARTPTTASELFPTAATPAGTYPYWAHFGAGAFAGLATFVLSAPTELIKCRAQVLESNPAASTRGQLTPTAQPTSSWAIAKTTFQQQGLRGLYHGGVVTSLRDSLGYGVYFWTYEVTKAAWDAWLRSPSQANDQGKPSAVNEQAKILLCGGLAGIATWASIFPLDVIKTRVQTQAGLFRRTAGQAIPLSRGVSLAAIHSAPGAIQVARDAYRTSGMPVFFRGLTICSVRAFIVNAVQWAVYEWMMRYLVP